MLVQKNLTPNCFGSKIFWAKKIWGPRNFGPGKFFGPKNLGQKKFSDLKNFRVQKNLGHQKIVWSKLGQ